MEHRIGIEAGVAIGQETLQSLIDQLPVASESSGPLGGNRVPPGLNQLQLLRQGQGHQIIHHIPDRGTSITPGERLDEKFLQPLGVSQHRLGKEMAEAASRIRAALHLR